MARGKLRGGMPRARATQPLGQRTPRNVVGPQVRALRKAQRLMQRDLCARCQVAGFDLSRESLAVSSGFACSFADAFPRREDARTFAPLV